jgi:glutathione S-transferase
MKLLHGKGSCSIGILVLIEELGVACEVQAVNLAAGEQRSPEYLALNPKGKVPALVLDDGAVLTEWPAIAVYLASLKPDVNLLPSEPLALGRTLEAVDYVVATVHMQGFTRIARPGNFAPSEADHDQVKARGREIFDAGLAVMDKELDGRDYVTGSFSIADAALFYTESWMVNRLAGPLPANCQGHFDLMMSRPAVQRALARAG